MKPFISLLALSLASCSSPLGFPGLHRLVLLLPEAPASWSCLGEPSFELEWIGADGRREAARGGPGGRIEVRLPRGLSQAIVARPRLAGHELSPAGALYPSRLAAGEGRFVLPGSGPGELALDWAGGYAAEVWRQLEDWGLEPRRFDLARLAGEAASRAADPWAALAPREAARRLAAGCFRADALRERAAFPASLPGPGPWAPESPLAAPPRAEAGAWAAELPEGSWRFVGREAELIVSMDAAGLSAWVRIPGP